MVQGMRLQVWSVWCHGCNIQWSTRGRMVKPVAAKGCPKNSPKGTGLCRACISGTAVLRDSCRWRMQLISAEHKGAAWKNVWCGFALPVHRKHLLEHSTNRRPSTCQHGAVLHQSVACCDGCPPRAQLRALCLLLTSDRSARQFLWQQSVRALPWPSQCWQR